MYIITIKLSKTNRIFYDRFIPPISVFYHRNTWHLKLFLPNYYIPTDSIVIRLNKNRHDTYQYNKKDATTNAATSYYYTFYIKNPFYREQFFSCIFVLIHNKKTQHDQQDFFSIIFLVPLPSGTAILAEAF